MRRPIGDSTSIDSNLRLFHSIQSIAQIVHSGGLRLKPHGKRTRLRHEHINKSCDLTREVSALDCATNIDENCDIIAASVGLGAASTGCGFETRRLGRKPAGTRGNGGGEEF